MVHGNTLFHHHFYYLLTLIIFIGIRAFLRIIFHLYSF
jgi:hypothetical protein